MSWPTPQPGLVIRYAYLWKSEAEAGREEGQKNRPCAIIVTAGTNLSRTRVIVLPITHAPPKFAADAIELPLTTKVRLGLDAARSWIVLSEGNDFVWPRPDLRPVPGQGTGSDALGFLPPRLFKTIRDHFTARVLNRQAGMTRRDE